MGRRTLALAVFFVSLPAHAICGRPPPVHVWPHRGVPVPTNARIVMSAPATWRGDASLTLMTAPRKGRAVQRVAMKEQTWRAAGTERFELTPLAALDPSTAYELRSSRGEVLGVFTTSVLEDKRPPAWAGLEATGGRLWREKKDVLPMECGVDLIHVDMVSPAIDDQTRDADIRYALWAGKPGSPLDYGAPPLTWATRERANMRLGLSYGSSDADDMDFELPNERPLRIGIKAYDLAANASDASEVTLE